MIKFNYSKNILEYSNKSFVFNNKEYSVFFEINKELNLLFIENIEENLLDSLIIEPEVKKEEKSFILLEIKKALLNYIDEEEAFLKFHITGRISDESYSDTELKDCFNNYPCLIRSFIDKNGEIIELRKTGIKNKYVKHDESDNILRDSNGMAIYLTDKEVQEKGLNLFDTTVGAFNEKKQRIGYASDEWGADGVWVNSTYQNRGIGTEILIEFRKQFPDNRKIGQATSLGIKLIKSYFKKTNQ